MKNVLFYLGAHLGAGLSHHINNYKKIYAFEANPDWYEILVNSFKNNDNVKIVHGAVCEKHNEEIYFNISKNNGDSSSLLPPNKNNHIYEHIETIKKVKVPTININNFCQENKIDFIDSYISDLQGYDFIVLKTLKNLIDNKLIGDIQCEVLKDNGVPIYDCENEKIENREKNFNDLLNHNYKQVSRGWGNLIEGVFNDVPPNWSELDIKWSLK